MLSLIRFRRLFYHGVPFVLRPHRDFNSRATEINVSDSW